MIANNNALIKFFSRAAEEKSLKYPGKLREFSFIFVPAGPQKSLLKIIKEVPLLAFLTRNISSNFFGLSSCQYVSTIPEKKNCILPTFEKSTFRKGLYRENDGASIWL